MVSQRASRAMEGLSLPLCISKTSPTLEEVTNTHFPFSNSRSLSWQKTKNNYKTLTLLTTSNKHLEQEGIPTLVKGATTTSALPAFQASWESRHVIVCSCQATVSPWARDPPSKILASAQHKKINHKLNSNNNNQINNHHLNNNSH